MIQAYKLSGTTYNVYFRLDLWDVMTSIAYRPLMTLTSQQTNRTKTFLVSNLNAVNKERYMLMYFISMNTDSEIPSLGFVYLGTREFPYGLYDVTLYQNKDTSNLDPAQAIKVIYKGLMNLSESGNPSVTYNKYESTQQQNVYITNTHI
tara:strand:- start:1421 stop:1867 length:447 start_codon:yes stop_codon:yes gene_type:complete